MSKELYKKLRPRKLDEIIGQNRAVTAIRKMIREDNVPHSILFSGPSGTGKTTLVRILRRHLKCEKQDFFEHNSSEFRGIDFVRDLARTVNLQPMVSPVRVHLIDECHKLTSDAQNAFLKLLEDTPEHVYFFLATTDPQKLIKAVIGRCSEIKLAPLSEDDLMALLKNTCTTEKFKIKESILEKIAEAAEGSARKALVILQQVAGHESEDEQLKALQLTILDKDLAFKLAQAVVWKKGWNEIAHLLKKLRDEEAEGIRYMILGYARTCLVGGEDKPPTLRTCPRAAVVIELFENNFYDSKHAGLALACWKAANI